MRELNYAALALGVQLTSRWTGERAVIRSKNGDGSITLELEATDDVDSGGYDVLWPADLINNWVGV